MVEYVLRKSCFVLVVVGVILHLGLAANINNTASEDINGQYLLDIGMKMKDPILQAIGLAITNHRHHRCGEWTPWTSCTASTHGYFGIKGRTRECGNESSTAKTETETDVSICRNVCPSEYAKTTNGFCVKIHNSPKLQVEADNQCRAEGGYLINIDSLAKFEDIVSLTNHLSPYIHIGGRRKDTDSPWMFGYGNQNGFFKWSSGEPSNGRSDLCLYLHPGQKGMHDGSCPQKFPFLCEISL